MKSLPVELEEAAIVDGAGLWVISRIFAPIMGPSLVTTGLLAFIGAWNEFMFAPTFIISNEQRTVPVAIGMLQGASQFELPWGNIMAASVVVTLPIGVMVDFPETHCQRVDQRCGERLTPSSARLSERTL